MNRYQFEAKLQSSQFNPSIVPVIPLSPKVATPGIVNQRERQFQRQALAAKKKELQTA